MTDATTPNRDDAARDNDARPDAREEEHQTDRDSKRHEGRDDTAGELHEGNGTELPPPDRRPSG